MPCLTSANTVTLLLWETQEILLGLTFNCPETTSLLSGNYMAPTLFSISLTYRYVPQHAAYYLGPMTGEKKKLNLSFKNGREFLFLKSLSLCYVCHVCCVHCYCIHHQHVIQ